ncbi:copper/silver efflux system outer membrane protein CusC [Kluyvera cryocrescens]|uniref:Copper/silver efflux system outer membrane protein CusC n=1 Tax=Kluyvera cryocrescens TaxID=580 RepID=A0A485AJ59_KLUCR|nr:copper/silver efflux system outer membrane protein CusC [Kluyvera cryocrescens]
MFRLSVLFIAFLSVGCVSLDPHYQRPDAPVPASLPGTQGQATAVIGNWQQGGKRCSPEQSGQHGAEQQPRCAKSDCRYRRRPRAVWRNACLAFAHSECGTQPVAAAAPPLPASAPRRRPTARSPASSWTCLAVTQSLTRAARETWLASEYTAQNTRLTMIAELSTAWVTLAADNSNLALAQQTHGQRRRLAENRPASAAKLAPPPRRT